MRILSGFLSTLLCLSYFQSTLAHEESRHHHRHHSAQVATPVSVASGPVEYYNYAHTAVSSLTDILPSATPTAAKMLSSL